MEKSLGYIDIAQEDGTSNPGAAHSRVKAKISGAVVSRSNAGVESALGGNLAAFGFVLGANTPVPGLVLSPIPGSQFSIPPGKTARIVAFPIIRYTVATGGTNAQTFGLRVNNPSGSNGVVSYSFSYKQIFTGAATAGYLFNGNSGQIAANTVSTVITYSGVFSSAVGSFLGIRLIADLVNTSTTTSATVEMVILPKAATDVFDAGSALFAIIS